MSRGEYNPVAKEATLSAQPYRSIISYARHRCKQRDQHQPEMLFDNVRQMSGDKQKQELSPGN